ncbi:hypothetical protein [Actinoplanes sp. TFC3]|uniref:hypothetical protein n=1 Tax=Actinoplanes sp. TFC3 TaxID=1710355 RepID=UPI00129060BC|nr:hypothetical protein [Actinoplanes sp. TFC3]
MMDNALIEENSVGYQNGQTVGGRFGWRIHLANYLINAMRSVDHGANEKSSGYARQEEDTGGGRSDGCAAHETAKSMAVPP